MGISTSNSSPQLAIIYLMQCSYYLWHCLPTAMSLCLFLWIHHSSIFYYIYETSPPNFTFIENQNIRENGVSNRGCVAKGIYSASFSISFHQETRYCLFLLFWFRIRLWISISQPSATLQRNPSGGEILGAGASGGRMLTGWLCRLSLRIQGGGRDPTADKLPSLVP